VPSQNRRRLDLAPRHSELPHSGHPPNAKRPHSDPHYAHRGICDSNNGHLRPPPKNTPQNNHTAETYIYSTISRHKLNYSIHLCARALNRTCRHPPSRRCRHPPSKRRSAREVGSLNPAPSTATDITQDTQFSVADGAASRCQTLFLVFGWTIGLWRLRGVREAARLVLRVALWLIPTS
jgi:hypothetical protein